MRVKRIISRVAEFVLCVTKRYKLKILQVYAPTTPYSEEDINSFNNDVDETLWKPNHYIIATAELESKLRRSRVFLIIFKLRSLNFLRFTLFYFNRIFALFNLSVFVLCYVYHRV